MNRKLIGSLILGCSFVLSAGIAWAQKAPPLPPDAMMHPGGPEGDFLPPPFGERMELLGFAGMHGGKVVTGAPFSATATTTQTLADGNQITRTSNLYRDSQGRVRREVTLPGGSHSFVVISDPVAGKQYLLRPDQKIAYEMPGRGMKGPGNGGPGNHQWKGNAEANVQKEAITTAPSMNFGVNVEGTQYTRIIPPGQIGNTNAIKIVSQRWYSPDLQIVVMSTHTDPRFGSTSYTLTNIKQQEPAAVMFTVPPGHTVIQGGPRGAMRRFRGGPPADAPAPPPSRN